MNANLASGGIWAADTWTDINKAATQEAAQVRVVQRVFPATLVPGALYVPADTLDVANMRMEEGATKPLVEMQSSFQLTQAQAEKEATEHTGRKLARRVAKTLALAEDLVLLQGQAIVSGQDVTVGGSAALSPSVRITDPKSVQKGLMQDACKAHSMPSTQYPRDVVQHVLDGVGQLTGLGEPGPYAFLTADDAYAKLYRTQGNSSATFLSIVKQVITAGLYSTGALRRTGGWNAAGAFGLLASLSGDSVSIYVGSEPHVAFIQPDPNGVLQFRVFERVQYAVRDKRALLRFEFS